MLNDWRPLLRRAAPFVLLALVVLFVAACAVYDWRTRGRVHRATVWGGLFVVLSVPLRLLVGNTAAWLSFAGWMTR